MTATVGLDIGGANLKAAHSDGTARCRSFPLWRSPERLADELRRLRAELPGHDVLAVTMTGELCDCFATRADGVRAILDSVEVVAGRQARLWTTTGSFVDVSSARQQPQTIASANWLALGYLAARLAGTGPALLVDAGSTTTDILFLEDGVPQPRGLTDRARLEAGELVYTGVRRTPVCAVLGLEVAAEFFATMLDAYLVLGLCAPDAVDVGTADGRPATPAHAHARLARLRCADAADITAAETRALATRAVQRQVQHVAAAVERVLAGRPAPALVVLSGSGEALCRQVCSAHARLATLPCIALSQRLGPALSEAAAAYGVALLAQQEASTHD